MSEPSRQIGFWGLIVVAALMTLAHCMIVTGDKDQCLPSPRLSDSLTEVPRLCQALVYVGGDTGGLPHTVDTHAHC